MIYSPLIWKKHKRRGDDLCPHCNAELKWIYDDSGWFPCDKEPVLFVMHPTGRHRFIYKKQELSNCVLFKPGDERTKGAPLWGHQQHYYTCAVLRSHRAEYAKNINENLKK